jgi:hypothetical protein
VKNSRRKVQCCEACAVRVEWKSSFSAAQDQQIQGFIAAKLALFRLKKKIFGGEKKVGSKLCFFCQACAV